LGGTLLALQPPSKTLTITRGTIDRCFLREEV
jgi:hypothetical protein